MEHHHDSSISAAHASKAWIPDARADLAQIRVLIQDLFSQLSKQYAKNPQQIAAIFQSILQSNHKLVQYRGYIQNYLNQQFTRIQFYTTIQANHAKISSKLYALQLLDEEFQSELQRYPYTRPERVKDEFSPIITNNAITAQTLSTAHLYPNEHPEATGASEPVLGTPNLENLDHKTPTASLDTILFMSKQLQYYRDGPNVPVEFRRSNFMYHPGLLHNGLLVKPPAELAAEIPALTM